MRFNNAIVESRRAWRRHARPFDRPSKLTRTDTGWLPKCRGNGMSEQM
jgi:hypothetical protein